MNPSKPSAVAASYRNQNPGREKKHFVAEGNGSSLYMYICMISMNFVFNVFVRLVKLIVSKKL